MIRMKEYEITPGNIPEHFTVHGTDNYFRRMPEEIAKTVSSEVLRQSKLPAGGRIRFRTDSPQIYVRVEFANRELNNGFEITSGGRRSGHCPPDENADFLEGTFYSEMCGEGKRSCDITVFLPRTVQLKRAVIGIEDGRKLEDAEPYKITAPIVFYGSSITMGACVGLPARTYTALVSEALGADHLNLGFGGAAKGEPEMARYIATLKMSAFVMDYDHNADTAEYLRETHKPFFDTVRRAQPDLPILLMSRPNTDSDFEGSCAARRVILDTFHAALDAGDKHVDFVDGFYLFGNYSRELCITEDGCHPSELGAQRMADTVYPRLKALTERK